MKKILSIFAIVVIFTACKNKKNLEVEKNKNMVLVDTTGLSKSNALTDVGGKYVIRETPVAASPKKSTPKSSGNNSEANNSNNSNNNNTSNSGSGTQNTTEAAPVQRDKGWSDAAKGTAIGGGTGAVLGAVINKKDPVTGAVIGTVVGAGTGYAIGRSRDKKSGRVARAKARRRANQ